MKNIVLGLSISLFFLLCACSIHRFSEPSYHTYDFSIKTVLVLPITSYQPYEREFLYLPFRGVITDNIDPKAMEEFNLLLKEKLNHLPYEFRFLSLNEFNNLLAEILSSGDTSHSKIVQVLTERTGTDALLYGKIYRYKEREGTGFAVNEPASVAFGLVLYEGKTGKTLWAELFDETQKPLSENILNIRLYKKIKWLTAKELASNGLDHLLKTFPSAKK